jgi:hypothetical protein
VLIDLHTHSDRSDGTLAPGELVRAADAAGLDVVALTDHDTAEGWPEAEQAAEAIGIRLVCGMEISCELDGRSVHLLAYEPNPDHQPLQDALALVLNGRDRRMPRICARLRDLGIDISEEQVTRRAGDAAAIGRPHIADTLVDLGVVGDRDEAFDRLLSPGRPAYVKRYAAPLKEMLGLVADAGGVSVIAHPWGRRGSRSMPADDIAALQEHGLVGIEVDHQDHPPEQRQQLRAIGRELGLVMTGSSDFHGAGKVGHDLGCNTTDPMQFERLMELADRARARRTSSAQ